MKFTWGKGLLDLYLNCYVHWQFANAWDENQPLGPLPVHILKPQPKRISEFVSILKNSQRPLFLVGSQALASGGLVSPSEMVAALEKLSIPVFLGGMARGLLGRHHRLNIRQNRKDALRRADCVILAGTVCDFRLGYGKALPKGDNVKIISINRDRSQMLKNDGLYWRCALGLQADVASSIVKLSEAFSSFKQTDEKEIDTEKWSGWLTELTEADHKKERATDEKARIVACKNADGSPSKLNPISVLQAFEQALPDEVLLVADGGDFVGSAAYILRPRGPLRWLDPGPFGTLGVGAGFALGAKVVLGKDYPVVIIYGDGACGYSLIEFDTFSRHGLPVTALIGNDACWSQIARDQVGFLGSNVGCQLAYSKYDEIGHILGAQSFLLEHNENTCSGEMLVTRFKQVLDDASKNNESLVINAVIGRSDFREGSISV